MKMPTPAPRRLVRILSLGLIALLASAAVALGKGAGPIAGATYAGTTKTGGTIVVAVAGNGKRVAVSESIPPLFCQGGAGGIEEVPKPLAISGGGSFEGTISYRAIHGKQVATLTVKGKFAGKRLTGTLSSRWLLVKGCNGTVTFSAKVAG
jgi:hypothetical protein